MGRSLLCGIVSLMILVIVVVSFITQTKTVEAMPGFARKYSMSCTTCHAPAPRLKDYGDEFAGNGFVLEDQDAPRYYDNTGDNLLHLIRDFQFGFRFEGFIKHHTETDNGVDFSFPYNVKIMSGGPIAPDIAYYFYFYMSEHGEIAGIEDAYVMFNNLFGSELDIYVGQFQISDPLFKRELRLTYEDYKIYTHRPDSSQVNLGYDRGIMMTYGFPTGTDLIFEVTNGNGIGETAVEFSRTYDSDKYKLAAGRISQDVGEYFRLGAFGLYGKEGNPEVSEITIGGIDATMAYGPFEANFQFLERKDSNPGFGQSPCPDCKTISRGGLAELIIMPHGDRSRFYMVGLYNVIDYDHRAVAYQSVTGHIGYLLHTNIRAFVENTYDIENEENRFVLGLFTAF